MRQLLKILVILVILAGVGVGIAIPVRTWLQERSQPRYVTAHVSRGRVETVVNSTGTVKPVRSISVGAFTSGPIKEVYVDFNSEVKKDQLLALIDPKLAQAAVAHDEAALEAQEADLCRVEALLEQAINNEKRAINLRDKKKEYISDTDMDTFKFTRAQNQAQKRLGQASIAQARATLENSRANLEYTKILAPDDGIVIDRKVDPGQTVAASFQTPELFIIAPEMRKHMYVYASVDEADIGQLSVAREQNRPVKLTVDAYPGDLFIGEEYIIRNNATTTQNVVTYPVVITVKNPDLKLRPNMTASISFQTDIKEDVLRVPAAALRFVPLPTQVRPEDRHFLELQPASANEGVKSSADQKAEQARSRQRRTLWVQDGLLLRAVPVTLGLIDNQFAEVVDGDLTEGQAVVTGTDSLLAPR